jgi:hypothetical protein
VAVSAPVDRIVGPRTLGSWIAPFADHVTMSCRVSRQGASAVDALVTSIPEVDAALDRST